MVQGYTLHVARLAVQVAEAMQVTIFEAAMPSMITAANLAAEHDLNPQLANLMVAKGLIVSFVTLSGWWWVMQGV